MNPSLIKFLESQSWGGGRGLGLVKCKCLTVCLWRGVRRRLCGGVWAWGLEERLGQVLLGHQGLQVVPLGEAVKVGRRDGAGPGASQAGQVGVGQGTVACGRGGGGGPLEIKRPGVQQGELGAHLQGRQSGQGNGQSGLELTWGGPGTFSAPGKGIFMLGLRKTPGLIGIWWWLLDRSRGSRSPGGPAGPACWWRGFCWSSSGRDLLLYSSRSVSICNQFKVFRTNKIQSSDDGSGLGPSHQIVWLSDASNISYSSHPTARQTLPS